MCKGIIFDFFGVISSEVAPFWFEKYFPGEAKELKNKYTHPADTGSISQKQFFFNLGALVGASAEQVESEFFSLVSINDLVVELIKDLKEDAKIALCSNAPAPFLREILSRHNLEGLFDSILISSEVGDTKPNLKIYQETLKDLQLAPAEVLFVDDNTSNVEGARAAGMKGIIFESAEQLRSILLPTSSNPD